MRARNLELAELLNWKVWQGAWKEPRVVFGNGKSISLDFDTDHNSMKEVWDELWKRQLFSPFLWKACGFEAGDPGELLACDIYFFLTDLPGQVNTAIRVLKDHRRQNEKLVRDERDALIPKPCPGGAPRAKQSDEDESP